MMETFIEIFIFVCKVILFGGILYFIIKWAVAGAIEISREPVTQLKPVKSCPQCGQGSPVDSQFCVGCGKPLPEQLNTLTTCPHCRMETPAGVSYCAYCGEKLP